MEFLFDKRLLRMFLFMLFIIEYLRKRQFLISKQKILEDLYQKDMDSIMFQH